jgi:hypothetical protein
MASAHGVIVLFGPPEITHRPSLGITLTLLSQFRNDHGALEPQAQQ